MANWLPESLWMHAIFSLTYGLIATLLHRTLGDASITWKSHLQGAVADSPNAAGYIALHEAGVATAWVGNLIDELGIKVSHTPVLYEDNDGVRRLAMSGMGQKKVRNLAMKYHYVQELCREGQIEVVTDCSAIFILRNVHPLQCTAICTL